MTEVAVAEAAQQRESQQSRGCRSTSSVLFVRRSSTSLWSFCPVSIISAGNVQASSTRCVSLPWLILVVLKDRYICSDHFCRVSVVTVFFTHLVWSLPHIKNKTIHSVAKYNKTHKNIINKYAIGGIKMQNVSSRVRSVAIFNNYSRCLWLDLCMQLNFFSSQAVNGFLFVCVGVCFNHEPGQNIPIL